MSQEGNKKICLWLGWEPCRHDDGECGYYFDLSGNSVYPLDFQNSNAAAIELLPVLVERGYCFELTGAGQHYHFYINENLNDDEFDIIQILYTKTISQAISSAILELIDREG